MKKLDVTAETRRRMHVILSRKEWAELRPLVKERNIDYYPSECGEDVYVSVYVNKADENYLNGCLYLITA